MKPSNRIILALDSHGLSHFQSCNRKYWFGEVEQLVSIGKVHAFELGSFIHDMIFRTNRLRIRSTDRIGYSRFHPPLTDMQILSVAYKRIARNKSLTPDERVFHIRKFTEFYSMQKNNFLTTVGAEVGFSKVIYEDRDVCFIYEGRIDEIVRLKDGTLAWVDFKSQSRETYHYVNSNQFIGYSWAIGSNFGFISPYGLQKEKSKEESFKLKSIFHDSALIDQWRADTIKSFRRIASLIPFGEEAFERNRSACDGKYRLCSYSRICDNAWAGREVIAGIKRTFFKRNEWHAWKEVGK